MTRLRRGPCDFVLYENSKGLWTLAANTLTARAAELANTFPRPLNDRPPDAWLTTMHPAVLSDRSAVYSNAGSAARLSATDEGPQAPRV